MYDCARNFWGMLLAKKSRETDLDIVVIRLSADLPTVIRVLSDGPWAKSLHAAVTTSRIRNVNTGVLPNEEVYLRRFGVSDRLSSKPQGIHCASRTATSVSDSGCPGAAAQ